MIDLNKKYKTKQGCDVVLYEIVDNLVFGRRYTDGKWYACNWYIKTGQLCKAFTNNMDLVEVPDFSIKSNSIHTKTVNYFGINVTVPAGIRYIATHSDGFVRGFYFKPEAGTSLWEGCLPGPVALMQIEFDGDWRESLMEIK